MRRGARDLQGIGDALKIQVFLVGVVERRVEVLPVGVIAPGVPEIDLRAKNRAVVNVIEGGFTNSSLDVATTDFDQRARRSRARGIGRNLTGCAEDALLLRTQQGIAAIDVVVTRAGG